MGDDASDPDGMIGRRALAGWMAGGLTLANLRPAHAAGQVDVRLVLAVDSSSSVDGEEFAIQMEGFAAAFRDPQVIEAVQMGGEQAVAVCLFEWSSPADQILSLPWTRLCEPHDFEQFANALENAPRRVVGGGTSISGALLYALTLLEACPFSGPQSTIDVSGDGRNNQGFLVSTVRDRLAALGITINGLAIVNEEPDLLSHYREEVIAGHAAFALETANYQTFAEAILRKLVKELSPGAVV